MLEVTAKDLKQSKFYHSKNKNDTRKYCILNFIFLIFLFIKYFKYRNTKIMKKKTEKHNSLCICFDVAVVIAKIFEK